MSGRLIAATVGVLLLVIACYALVGESARGQAAGGANQPRWEYKVIDESQGAHGGASNVQSVLNKLGQDGWELCGSSSDGFSESASSPTRTRMYFVLKRPK